MEVFNCSTDLFWSDEFVWCRCPNSNFESYIITREGHLCLTEFRATYAEKLEAMPYHMFLASTHRRHIIKVNQLATMQ